MNNFNIRVYGLLINNNQEVLLSDERIKGNYYTKFPGGGLEFGEGTKDCIIREFKEETGLDVEVEKHFYTTDFFQKSFFNNQQQIISIYYLVKCKNLSKLKTITKEFDFTNTTATEVFRWQKISLLSVQQLTLPIDKIVVEMLLKKKNV